jgi:hypothetical protein
LEKSPYGNNGRYRIVTVQQDTTTVRDGIFSITRTCVDYNYFNNFTCSRERICPVQARVPKGAQPGNVPAIMFGHHKHQLVSNLLKPHHHLFQFDNGVYNLETGLSHELERLLQIVLDLAQRGVDLKELFAYGGSDLLWSADVSIFRFF